MLKDWPRTAGMQAHAGWWHGSHAAGSDIVQWGQHAAADWELGPMTHAGQHANGG